MHALPTRLPCRSPELVTFFLPSFSLAQMPVVGCDAFVCGSNVEVHVCVGGRSDIFSAEAHTLFYLLDMTYRYTSTEIGISFSFSFSLRECQKPRKAERNPYSERRHSMLCIIFCKLNPPNN